MRVSFWCRVELKSFGTRCWPIWSGLLKSGSVFPVSVGFWSFLLFFSAVALTVWPSDAEAIPAFAKKYSAPCNLCHSSWPELNKVGWRFKINGYQTEDGRDGAEVGKFSPTFDLNLDIGNANPPISLRFGGGINLYSPQSRPGINPSPDDFACCTRDNTLKLYAAGTVGTDLGYYVSYPLTGRNLEQAYLRYVNLFGQGSLGIDLGAFRTADFDSVSPHREWFAEPNTAFYGNSTSTAGDQGLTAGYQDTGIRLFGNPDYGSFSYDLIYVSGTRAEGLSGYSNGSAVSAMGRIDAGRFSGSLRYWNSESADLTFKNTGGVFSYNLAGDGEFNGNPAEPDETTQDYILALKYGAKKWQTELVYDFNVFQVDPRTAASGDVYSRDKVTHSGLSVAAILRINSLITMGGRYGFSTVGSYSYDLNGAATVVPAANTSKVEIRMEFTPVQNARIALQYTLDDSNGEARKNDDGTVYGLQNNLTLLWDWAI
ncbi:MAG: hypothetical protein IEMM0002_0295 [bacterium]|nr:MAG: hypothetical protein IEMM0002_0295 [bacterium]